MPPDMGLLQPGSPPSRPPGLPPERPNREPFYKTPEMAVTLGIGLLERIEIIVESGRLSGGRLYGSLVYALQGKGLTPFDLVFVSDGRTERATLKDMAMEVVSRASDHRSDPAGLLVLVVVHLVGATWLSPQERDELSDALDQASVELASGTILVGVHATSPQVGLQPVERPWSVTPHMVRWSSTSVSHQLAMYDLTGTPVGLGVVD